MYPFESHYLDRNGLKYHYLDEGTGDPVVMVHGNPSWSFLYRNVVLALRGQYRTVVPDHIGCGFSDKPDDSRYAYRLERRIDDLEALLEHLGIVRDVTLVVHDWGGMIGLGWAARHPERLRRLVVLNTSGFPLPSTKPLPWTLWLCRNTPIGAFLVRGFNAFSFGATYMAVNRRPLSPEVSRPSARRRFVGQPDRHPPFRSGNSLKPAIRDTTSCRGRVDTVELSENPGDDLLGTAGLCVRRHFLENGNSFFPRPRCIGTKMRGTMYWKTRARKSSR
jgi:haloalkane dehalogenase